MAHERLNRSDIHSAAGQRRRLSRSPWKLVAAVGCDGYTVTVIGVSWLVAVWMGVRCARRSR
ncbi:MAG: hypothetical protein ACLQBY_03565, partial [Solirubrobacteraceae bacterium]